MSASVMRAHERSRRGAVAACGILAATALAGLAPAPYELPAPLAAGGWVLGGDLARGGDVAAPSEPLGVPHAGPVAKTGDTAQAATAATTTTAKRPLTPSRPARPMIAAGVVGAPGVVRAAIAFVTAQLGVPYAWGGDGGVAGFDCSGLTVAAYAAAGIALPRTAQTQFDRGPAVPDGAPLLPGDLVFYGTPDRVHHVGIYLGAERMIDAPSTGRSVEVTGYHVAGDDYLGATRPAGGRLRTTTPPVRAVHPAVPAGPSKPQPVPTTNRRPTPTNPVPAGPGPASRPAPTSAGTVVLGDQHAPLVLVRAAPDSPALPPFPGDPATAVLGAQQGGAPLVLSISAAAATDLHTGEVVTLQTAAGRQRFSVDSRTTLSRKKVAHLLGATHHDLLIVAVGRQPDQLLVLVADSSDPDQSDGAGADGK